MTDNIIAVNMAIEIAKKRDCNGWIFFLDISKVYDRVAHN